jgi:integrase
MNARLVQLKNKKYRQKYRHQEKYPSTRAWHLSTSVILALETGMRLGELANLTWERLDLPRQVAHLADTKNGSARSIPLSMRAAQALSALPHALPGKVFPVHVDTIKQAFRSAVARGRRALERELADIGMGQDAIQSNPLLTDLRFHDLRHEAVSRLFERGLNPMEVAAISGHKTLAMLQRYTHLRAEDLVLKLR